MLSNETVEVYKQFHAFFFFFLAGAKRSPFGIFSYIFSQLVVLSGEACYLERPLILKIFKISFIQVVNIRAKNDTRNVPKFSDRQVWANSADPDQTGEV